MAQTVKTELTRAKGLLTAAGIDSPGLDAEILLSHTLGFSRIDLIIHRDKAVTDHETEVFQELLARRLEREPVAYILGVKEFYGRSFKVGPQVLIPRPETEALVELSISNAPEGGSILEIGVGSGAVIVSLLCERDDLRGYGTDISIDAIRLARLNALNHGVSKKLTLYCGDVFGGLRASFPLIIANPPYVALTDAESLADDVARYEPTAALFGGKDGLDIVKEIITEAPGHLAPGGALIMEVGLGQQHSVERMVSCRGGLRVRHWEKDLSGIHRTVIIERAYG